MRFTKTATSAAAALALAAGLGLASAGTAHAGTSVPPTKNGRTGVTWAYYASTDKLCIKRPVVGDGGYIMHAYGTLSTSNVKRGKWHCMDMKSAGAREGKSVKIFLYGKGATAKSTTHISI